MNLRNQKAALMLAAVVFAATGVVIGSLPFLSPLPTTRLRIDEDPVGPSTPIGEDVDPASDFSMLARRLQGPPPKPVIETVAVQNTAPPTETVVVIPPPQITVTILYGSDNNVVVGVRNSSGVTQLATVGDVIFSSTPLESVIKEVDLPGNRVLVDHRNKEFWLQLVRAP